MFDWVLNTPLCRNSTFTLYAQIRPQLYKVDKYVSYLSILSGIVTLSSEDEMMKIILKGIFSTTEESVKHSEIDHAEGNEP